jgi:transposase
MRFRLYPSAAQEVLLLGACGQARFVWNLGLEQRLMWARWKGPTPGFNAQAAQLTEARAAEPWLAAGSQTVQQQALRDLDQAWRLFFAGTHRRPRWRKAGQHEGLRIVGPQALRVRQDNGARSSVLVPKVGWVRGSNRRRKVRTLIGQLKAREVDRRKDWVEKTSTDLARRFDVIRVENLNIKAMTRSARGTMENPGRNVAQKAGLNQGILKSGWGLLVTRLEQKAPGRVEKVKAAYTSQTCNACKRIASESRKSQATFVCVACGHQGNADVNAARNIAAGHVVTARGDLRVLARSVKREPQHARPPKVA